METPTDTQIAPPVIPKRLVRFEKMVDKDSKIRNIRSNHIIFFSECRNVRLSFPPNQRFTKLILSDCHKSTFQVLDSCVLSGQQIVLVNCTDLTLMVDCIDIRNITCVNCKNITIQFSDFETILDNLKIYFQYDAPLTETVSHRFERTHIKAGTDPNLFNCVPVVVVKGFDIPVTSPSILVTLPDGKSLNSTPIAPTTSASTILDSVRSAEENNKEVDALSREQMDKLYDSELSEYNDSEEELLKKVKQIAAAIRASGHTTIVTGAGISTSASIPDYRGPQGVWTQRNRGNLFAAKDVVMEEIRPTYAHYAIADLIKKNKVQYLISSNLDGLHRRSGVPADKISELHGNCYREVCATCGKEYLRYFDTLTSRLDRWSHLTGRDCSCGGPLKDTIVHFTENLEPKIWNSAVQNSRKADVCLVLGTSLNVHPGSSLVDKAKKLFIVNLQITPYDGAATLKVHAKTDEFMTLLMQELGMDGFDRTYDHLDFLAEEEYVRNRNFLYGTFFGSIAAFFTALYLKKKF